MQMEPSAYLIKMQMKGYQVEVDSMIRFGIKVVNEFTKEKFLDNIVQYKISTEELKKMLMN